MNVILLLFLTVLNISQQEKFYLKTTKDKTRKQHLLLNLPGSHKAQKNAVIKQVREYFPTVDQTLSQQ